MRCNPGSEEDERLVQQCLEGNQQAWAELVRRYRGLVYAIAARFGATRDDGADILQAVCIEVLNSLPQLKNARSLRSWLITLTVRQSSLWKRRRFNHLDLDDMDADQAEEIAFNPDLPSAVSRSQQEQIVREGVAQLPARSAELLRLLFFEQPPLPYEEVARRLGLATGSIGFIRGRALIKLRKILAEAGLHENAVL
ncbi:MAG TPA: RNA polymerase sigma factor, partial [Terriglobales bacterium]|nr:RNA polymerase sigma factor [Terriglobales bacterium]